MTYKQLYDGIEAALSRPAKTLAIYHKLASTTDASLYDVVSGCNALYRADRIRPTADTADMQPNEIVWERVPEVVARGRLDAGTRKPTPAIQMRYVMDNNESALFFDFMARPEWYNQQKGYQQQLDHFVHLGLATKTTEKPATKKWLCKQKTKLKAARRALRSICLLGSAARISKLSCEIGSLARNVASPEVYGPKPKATYKPTDKARELFASSTVVISFDQRRFK